MADQCRGAGGAGRAGSAGQLAAAIRSSRNAAGAGNARSPADTGTRSHPGPAVDRNSGGDACLSAALPAAATAGVEWVLVDRRDDQPDGAMPARVARLEPLPL